MQFIRAVIAVEINVSLLELHGYGGIWTFSSGSHDDRASWGCWSNLWLFQEMPVEWRWRKSRARQRLLDFVKKCTNSTLRTLTDNLGWDTLPVPL
jgi:hypothetical protein